MAGYWPEIGSKIAGICQKIAIFNIFPNFFGKK
jgi:hypothetical protein